VPTLLISDLHLDASRPETTDLFLDFLTNRAASANTLYILGDLFEAWIGDDDDAPLARRTVAALSKLVRSGTAVAFMRGNRDFLIGEKFARNSGCVLMPAEKVVNLAGEKTLLMHGDELCTDDIAYQTMRKTLDSEDWQKDFLTKPLIDRRHIATSLRATSAAATALKDDSIMDVNQAAVVKAMARHRVRRLIHGHTHRPGHYEVRLEKEIGERIVLADWRPQGSALVCENGRPPYFEAIG
jgi:UDP-2,3-diacylglucosamine hydrolase